jgi:hypothetical protein
MMRLFISLILTTFLLPSFGQDLNRKFNLYEYKCKNYWKYVAFKDTTYGEVLFHSTAIGLCGAIATASLSIIKTASGDTIRVLELCNVLKNFKKNTRVKVSFSHFSQEASFDINTPSDEYYYCEIYKTCYGVVTKLDN